MVNVVETQEHLEKGGWIGALQGKAIAETNKTQGIVENFNKTERDVSILNILKQKKIKKNIEEKNSEILNQEIEIKYNWVKLDKFKTLSEVLNSNNKPEEKIQIIVESIHWMKDRVDLKNKKDTPFYCWDRALLLYQIFKENKEILWIQEVNIGLPYWHVMNIIKIGDKTYIADAGAWCFNDITNNFEIEKKWEWEIMKLKEPIRLYNNNNKFYWFTSFPTTKNLGDSEFLYTGINIQMYEHFVTNKLYEIAQSTKWYEKTANIEDLEKFLKEVVYKKDNPYKDILNDWDVLLTFSKDKQIEMIKGQIYHKLSYKENKDTLKNLEDSSKEISEKNPDYNIENREEFLGEFYKEDKEITKALNLLDKDKDNIVTILKNNNQEEWDTEERLTKKIINKLIKLKWDNEESLLWEKNEDLEIKLTDFLKALNLRANQGNSTLEKELETMFREYFIEKEKEQLNNN